MLNLHVITSKSNSENGIEETRFPLSRKKPLFMSNTIACSGSRINYVTVTSCRFKPTFDNNPLIHIRIYRYWTYYEVSRVCQTRDSLWKFILLYILRRHTDTPNVISFPRFHRACVNLEVYHVGQTHGIVAVAPQRTEKKWVCISNCINNVLIERAGEWKRMV